VLGIPQTSVLVFWQHKELGDRPSPINCRHQVHKLNTVDRATWRPVPRPIHGLRHEHGSELEPCVHHLRDQGVATDTSAEPIAKPEANPRRVAPSFAVTFAFATTNLIALA